MSKFGELIDVDIPVLFDFFKEDNVESRAMHVVLREVAGTLGDKIKVIKIDVEKNHQLAEALQIKGLPTLIVYKDGEMKWRHTGNQDMNTLISIVEEFL